MIFDSAGLYGIVEQYAAFGNHHTGTEADRATTDWLVDLLQDMGGETKRFKLEQLTFLYIALIYTHDRNNRTQAVPVGSWERT